MKAVLVLLVVLVVALAFYSCLTPEEKDERTARTYCSNCHLFPDPSLLSKQVWLKGVLPQMAFRMGRDYARLSAIPEAERAIVMEVLPDHSMLTDEEWQANERYYEKNSPDSLNAPVPPVPDTLKDFNPEPFRIDEVPTITMIRLDSLSKKVFVGSRKKLLYRFDNNLNLEHTDTLVSTPSDIRLYGAEAFVLQMGIMDPNDEPEREV